LEQSHLDTYIYDSNEEGEECIEEKPGTHE